MRRNKSPEILQPNDYEPQRKPWSRPPLPLNTSPLSKIIKIPSQIDKVKKYLNLEATKDIISLCPTWKTYLPS